MSSAGFACAPPALAAAWIALAGTFAGCADWRAPATFPEGAAHQTFIEEQALLGFDARGDALAVQLLAVEGGEPQLGLLVFDRDAGPTRTLLVAGMETARAVSGRVVQDGRSAQPLLAAAVGALWPEANLRAVREGFVPAAPSAPEPALQRWTLRGAGGLPLSLRIAESTDGAPAEVLMLAEEPARERDGDELELVRMPLSGLAISPLVWLNGSRAWMLAGSVRVRSGEPLHRAVGLRRGSLARGEALLHNQHGLADYAAGELDAARRELDRALLADPRCVDALYNAASVAALTDRADDAVAFLQRAADEDPRRVQVLGRDDEDLKTLRRRPDVRAILGLTRMPPGE